MLPPDGRRTSSPAHGWQPALHRATATPQGQARSGRANQRQTSKARDPIAVPESGHGNRERIVGVVSPWLPVGPSTYRGGTRILVKAGVARPSAAGRPGDGREAG